MEFSKQTKVMFVARNASGNLHVHTPCGQKYVDTPVGPEGVGWLLRSVDHFFISLLYLLHTFGHIRYFKYIPEMEALCSEVHYW